MTSQNPNPLFTADFSLSIETYLPRRTPSMSNPPIFALVIPRSSRLLNSFVLVGHRLFPFVLALARIAKSRSESITTAAEFPLS